jgi:hypothetical protein
MFTGLHMRKLGIRTLARILQVCFGCASWCAKLTNPFLFVVVKVPFAEQSPILQNTWPHIMPTALVLFSKLSEAYERLCLD